jgi:hypothetical protein
MIPHFLGGSIYPNVTSHFAANCHESPYPAPAGRSLDCQRTAALVALLRILKRNNSWTKILLDSINRSSPSGRNTCWPPLRQTGSTPIAYTFPLSSETALIMVTAPERHNSAYVRISKSSNPYQLKANVSRSSTIDLSVVWLLQAASRSSQVGAHAQQCLLAALRVEGPVLLQCLVPKDNSADTEVPP